MSLLLLGVLLCEMDCVHDLLGDVISDIFKLHRDYCAGCLSCPRSIKMHQGPCSALLSKSASLQYLFAPQMHHCCDA